MDLRAWSEIGGGALHLDPEGDKGAGVSVLVPNEHLVIEGIAYGLVTRNHDLLYSR